MQGKHSKPLYWNKKRIVCVVLSAVLLLACLSFSGLAWFTYQKVGKRQVFIGSKMEIGFMGDKDTTYPLIPGKTYMLEEEAIPRVTIVGNENGIDCYLYALYEVYWYDLYDKSFDGNQDHLYGYPISIMYRDPGGYHDPFNDTYHNNGRVDKDNGYIDYFGFDNAGISAYNTDSYLRNADLLDIKDGNGNIIGRRYLFGFRNGEHSAVFSTKEDQFVYVLECEASNTKRIVVNEYLTKEQVNASALKGKEPKVVVSGYAVQALGVSRDEATALVADAILAGSAQQGVLQ